MSLNDFIKDREFRGVGGQTLTWYRAYLNPWLDRNEPEDPRERLHEHLQRYGPSTRKTAWTAIRAYEKWLAKRDNVPAWVDEVKIRFDPAPVYPTLTEPEFTRIIEQLSGTDKLIDWRDRTVYTVLYYTGQRLNAIRELRVGDVDLDCEQVMVTTKGGVRAPVHLPRPAIRALTPWLKQRPDTPNAVVFPSSRNPDKPICLYHLSHRLPKLAAAAGIKKRVWVHGLRHSAITEWLERDVPIEIAQRQALHRDIQTTLKYNHLRFRRVQRALNAAFD